MGGAPLIWPTEGIRINDTHLSYNNHIYNSTTLEEFNYSFYSNGTLSNHTNCYLAFPPYSFHLNLVDNGTVYNGSSCTASILPVEARGGVGIALGVIHGILLVCALSCLKKHGTFHLPPDRNFSLVSRRWQWYWFFLTSACAMISCFTAIDVDRNYTQSIALILTNFFYYITLPAMMASIWEMTRHWGSFCERLVLDEDSFKYLHGDARSQFELYIPLVFYLWGFLTFFLACLRSWTSIPKGNWHAATDARFKASAIFPIIGFIVILISIAGTMRYYQPYARRIPWKIPFCLGFILIRIGYNIAVAWDYDIGPLKWDASLPKVYVLGYMPILLVMITMVVYGFWEENDDIRLKKIRKERHKHMDRELGLRPMPSVKVNTMGSGISGSTFDSKISGDTIVDGGYGGK